jgi:catalase
VTPSPALSQIVDKPGPVAGRKVGVIADAGADVTGINKLKTSMRKLDVTVLVVAPVGGVLGRGRTKVTVDRTRLTARSIEFDAIVVADGTDTESDLKRTLLLQEAYHHCKTIAAWGDADAILTDAGIPVDGPGIIVAEKVVKAFTDGLSEQLGLHRAWARADLVRASAVPPVR